MSATDTVVFFGATGGCTLQALKLTIQACVPTRALARSSEKLKKLLIEKGVAETAIADKLVIIEGNAKEEAAVAKALTLPDGSCAKRIVFGVGGKMSFANPLKPALDDPHVTKECMAAVLAALKALKPAEPPLLATISTTGITEKRDVPFAMLPLYNWMLGVPHADKKEMETLLNAAVAAKEVKAVVIRPSFLQDGPAKPVRAGYEGAPAGPAVGYVISRDSVGTWFYEEVLKKPVADVEWVGKAVTITNGGVK